MGESEHQPAKKITNLPHYLGLDWLIDYTTNSEKSVFWSWTRVLLTLKLLKKRKNHFQMIFLFKKIRSVQIHDEMAMGAKRASEWACWCIWIWTIKQSIEKLSVRSMCITKRFHGSLSVSIWISHVFLDSKQKSRIRIFPQISRANWSLWIIPKKKLQEMIGFRQKLLVSRKGLMPMRSLPIMKSFMAEIQVDQLVNETKTPQTVLHSHLSLLGGREVLTATASEKSIRNLLSRAIMLRWASSSKCGFPCK